MPAAASTPATGLARFHVAVVLLSGLSCIAPVLAASPARLVEIQSDWTGMSPEGPSRTHLSIERQGHDYLLTGTSGHGDHPDRIPATHIDAVKVAALVDALGQPAQDRVTLAWVGSLQPLARKAVHDDAYAMSSRYALPQQRALIAATVDDPEKLRDVLMRGLTQGFHTDDYPTVSITATLADGTVLTASSHAQHADMLPWERKPGGKTFADDIPRALSAVLPPNATNADRLGGAPREFDLGEMLTDGLHEPLDRLSAEAVAAPALHELEARYRVEEIRLDGDESQLYATLHHADEGIDFSLWAHLPLHAGALVKSSVLFQQIDRDFTTVRLSAPLMAELARMPKGGREARIVALRSYGDGQSRRIPVEDWAGGFLETLKQRHEWPDVVRRPDMLLDGLRVELKGSGGSKLWIVLPDGRALPFQW